VKGPEANIYTTIIEKKQGDNQSLPKAERKRKQTRCRRRNGEMSIKSVGKRKENERKGGRPRKESLNALSRRDVELVVFSKKENKGGILMETYVWIMTGITGRGKRRGGRKPNILVERARLSLERQWENTYALDAVSPYHQEQGAWTKF